MNGFRRTDRRKVAVALIGEDHGIRMGTLHAGRHRRSSAVRCLDHIAVKIVVCEYGAANGSHTHGIAFNAKLVDDLCHKPVYDTMGTTGTVVQRYVAESVRSVKYSFHILLLVLSPQL